jgi:hypothetical protein
MVLARTFEVGACKIRNPGISKNIDDAKRILASGWHWNLCFVPMPFVLIYSRAKYIQLSENLTVNINHEFSTYNHSKTQILYIELKT